MKKSWYWGLLLLLMPYLVAAQNSSASLRFGEPSDYSSELSINPYFTRVEPGEQVHFEASGGSGNYQWQVVNGSLSSSQGDSVIYTAPQCPSGGCEDFVTVSDNTSGNSETAEIKIDKERSCDITPDQVTLAPGGSQTFTVTYVEGQVDWTADSGNIIERGPEAFYTAPDIEGTYSLTATAFNCQVTAIIVDIRNCEITPQIVTLRPGGLQQFRIVGENCDDFNWMATKGDIGKTGLYTAPGTFSSDEVTIIDSAGNRKTASVSVRLPLSITPQEISLQPEQEKYITVITGNKPYRATATQGDISPSSSDDVYIFTASSEVGEDAIEICDDTPQCQTIPVYVEGGLSLRGLPKLVQISEKFDITVTGGKGDYDYDAELGQIDIIQQTGEGTYTAPDTDGEDMITIIHSAGNKLERTIEVKGYIPPYISPNTNIDMEIGETRVFSVGGGIPPFKIFFTGGLYEEIDERKFQITAQDRKGTYDLSVMDAKSEESVKIPVTVGLPQGLTPKTYTVYKGETPKVRFDKHGGVGNCEWFTTNLEENEIVTRKFEYIIVMPRVKDVALGKEYKVTCRDDVSGEESSAIITVDRLKYDSDEDGIISNNEASRGLEQFFANDMTTQDKTILFINLEAFFTTQ